MTEEPDKLPLYLIWVLDRADDPYPQLRAIDTASNIARRHVKMFKDEARLLGKQRRVWMEEREANHAFGCSMICTEDFIHGIARVGNGG